MLIKINEVTLNAASSKLKMTFYNDALDNTVDISSLNPATDFANMLILESLTGVGLEPTVIPITSFAFTATVPPEDAGKAGALTLTFDAGSTITDGDFLSLRQGTLISSLGRIQNTASISINIASATASTTTTEGIITPLTTKTSDKLYKLAVNIITADGTTLSTQEYETATQFTVNGTKVYSITVTVDNSTSYDANTQIPYTVAYKNELGESLELQIGDLTTVSAYLKPQA